MCNGNILNIEAITKLQLREILTYMCFEVDKQNIEKQKQKNK